MIELIQSENALEDVREIWQYIAERDIDAADRVVRDIDCVYQRMREFPQIGRIRDDISSGLRSAISGKYVIFYQATATSIQIVRVLHGARDIERVFKGTLQP
ncbi:MAG TPA: type II toxin-antitoxin system RelE/ParE family toxin [Planctomycetota bacterium]|nr:type II toxin-antitoxin system RelE/ParE family toxin [Planctomycetota bacterium]